MRKLTKEDILKNGVDTLSQYYILDYLKNELKDNIDEFEIYLVDRDNIKVVDKENEHLYFNYDTSTKEVTYQDEIKIKEHDYEMGL